MYSKAKRVNELKIILPYHISVWLQGSAEKGTYKVFRAPTLEGSQMIYLGIRT